MVRPDYGEIPLMDMFLSAADLMQFLESSFGNMSSADIIRDRLQQLQQTKVHQISANYSAYSQDVKNKEVDKFLNDQGSNFVYDRPPSPLLSVANSMATKPKRLVLSIKPYDSWLTVEGETHLIVVTLLNRYALIIRSLKIRINYFDR